MMKPSDKLRKFILEFLKKDESRPDTPMVDKLINEGMRKGYSSDQIIDELTDMDNHHEKLLTVQIAPVLGGNPILAVSEPHWITSKGHDYLFYLENPDEANNIKSEFNFNGPVNNIGQSAYGNGSVFNGDNQVNISNSLDNLESLKTQFDNAEDQFQFAELVQELRKIAERDGNMDKGKLGKFRGFVKKTSSVIGSALSIVLAQLSLQYLGLK